MRPWKWKVLRTGVFLLCRVGEQQRVILARALAQQTPCLILDEPTNHLDITHQIQLMKIVKNSEGYGDFRCS